MYTAKRFENIDIFRGIAAILVAFMHTREICWVGMQAFWAKHHFSFNPLSVLGYATFPFKFGSIGVPIFFVISGYLIHRNQYLRLSNNDDYQINKWLFLKRRFIRIYPILLLALITTFLLDNLSMIKDAHYFKLGDLSLKTFLGNLFALQGLAVNTYGSNVPLWSLSIEIQLYVFYVFAFDVRKKIGIQKLGIILIIINIISAFFTKSLFTSYLICWWAGAYIVEIENKITLKKTTVLFWSAVFLLIGSFLFLISEDKYQILTFTCWSVFFCFFLMFSNRITYKRNLLFRLLDKIGIYSYSLYIIHLPIVVVLYQYVLSGQQTENILIVTLIFILVLLLTYLFYWLFERPVLKYLENNN